MSLQEEGKYNSGAAGGEAGRIETDHIQVGGGQLLSGDGEDPSAL